MDSRQILFALLRMQVCGANVGEEIKKAFSPQILQEVYSLALKHDMAHIAGQALSELGCLGDNEPSQKLKKQAMLAVYRHARMEQEFKSICKTLEEAQIPYIPLKGAVLRRYYPEPWMRTSCDIDVLVRPSELDAAADALVRRLGYEKKGKGDHDLSLFSPTGIHLELHYTVVEQEWFPQTQTVLVKMWEHAEPEKPTVYCHALTDKMLYFFHIAHMAKHVESGGCGIKSLLDTWILNHRVGHDRREREILLAQGGLLTFAKTVENLSEVWFSETQADALSLELERFILEGGVYGSLKNAVAVKQTKKGGSLRYFLYKFWLPYAELKYYYPTLQKHKWLLPFCQIRRWGRIVFGGGLKRAVETVKTNATVEPEEQNAIKQLLDKLGLQ